MSCSYRVIAQSRGGNATYELIARILEKGIANLDAGKDLAGKELEDGDVPPPTELVFSLLHLAQVGFMLKFFLFARAFLPDPALLCLVLRCSQNCNICFQYQVRDAQGRYTDALEILDRGKIP